MATVSMLVANTPTCTTSAPGVIYLLNSHYDLYCIETIKSQVVCEVSGGLDLMRSTGVSDLVRIAALSCETQ